MSLTCPFCEIGTLAERTVVEVIQFAGTDLKVPGVLVSDCPNCHEVLVTPDQAKANARVFADAKRTHEGLLPSQAIAAWRKSFGFTQLDAARLLGGGTHAFSKYERGEVTQSRAMDWLMRITGAFPETIDFVSAHAVGLKIDVDRTSAVKSIKISTDWISEDVIPATSRLKAVEKKASALNYRQSEWDTYVA